MLKFDAQKCTLCGACARRCAQLYFKEEDVEKSAIRIHEDGEVPHIQVCNQCGECLRVCQTIALSKNKKGVVVVDKNKCVGCLNCVAVCPQEALFYHSRHPIVFKCISCGACVRVCETQALRMEWEG